MCSSRHDRYLISVEIKLAVLIIVFHKMTKDSRAESLYENFIGPVCVFTNLFQSLIDGM